MLKSIPRHNSQLDVIMEEEKNVESPLVEEIPKKKSLFKNNKVIDISFNKSGLRNNNIIRINSSNSSSLNKLDKRQLSGNLCSSS